ncbi:uncharacterized protein JCM10292_004956 [Rhodotorula paludigena]|uniref:uncharacterized protein n=1 Tax=Rhodotorula paludigena TaxID=86838 RepID=UPI003180A4C4
MQDGDPYSTRVARRRSALPPYPSEAGPAFPPSSAAERDSEVGSTLRHDRLRGYSSASSGGSAVHAQYPPAPASVASSASTSSTSTSSHDPRASSGEPMHSVPVPYTPRRPSPSATSVSSASSSSHRPALPSPLTSLPAVIPRRRPPLPSTPSRAPTLLPPQSELRAQGDDAKARSQAKGKQRGALPRGEASPPPAPRATYATAEEEKAALARARGLDDLVELPRSPPSPGRQATEAGPHAKLPAEESGDEDDLVSPVETVLPDYSLASGTTVTHLARTPSLAKRSNAEEEADAAAAEAQRRRAEDALRERAQTEARRIVDEDAASAKARMRAEAGAARAREDDRARDDELRRRKLEKMRIVEEEERALEEREQPPPPLEPEEAMLPLVDRKEPRETPPPFGVAQVTARAIELRQQNLAPPSEASEAPSAWSEPVAAPDPLDSLADSTHRRSNTVWDGAPALPAPESFLSAAQRARPGPTRGGDAGPGPPPASTAASPAFSRPFPDPARFATSQTRIPSFSPSRAPTQPPASAAPAPAFYTSLVPGGPLLPFYASPASTPGHPVSYVSPAGASALPPPPAQPVYASAAAGGAYPFPSVSSGGPIAFPASAHGDIPAASPAPPVAQQQQHAPQGLAALRPWSRSSTVSPGSVSSHAGEGADATLEKPMN